MTAVWQVVRKDLHRLRWELALFGTSHVAGGLVVALQLSVSQTVWWWVVGAQMALAVTVVVLLVQIDPLVDSCAFWRTRPIARASLVTAKLVFATVLLIAFPVAVAGAAAVAGGLQSFDVGLGLAATAVEQALLIAPTLALASFTASFRGFVVSALVTIGAWLAATVTLAAWRTEVPSWVSYRPPTLTISRQIVSIGVVLAAGTAIYALHTLTLKRRLAVAGFVTALVTTVAALTSWQLDVVAASRSTVAWSDVSGVRLQFRPDHVSIESGFTLYGKEKSIQQMLAGFTWEGLPDSVVPTAMAIYATFRDADGSEWHHDEPFLTLRRVFDAGGREGQSRGFKAVTAAVGPHRWLNSSGIRDFGEQFTVLEMPADRLKAIEGHKGVLRIDVGADFARYEVGGRAALRPGTRLVVPGSSTIIRGVRIVGPPEARTILGDSYIVRIDPLPRLAWPSLASPIIRNSQRGEALFAQAAPTRLFTLTLLEAAPFHLGFGPVTFRTSVANAPQLDQAWVEGAEIVSIRPVYMGRATVSVSINDFVVKATRRTGE